MVHTNALSSKFSTLSWLPTPQLLLQTCRFAYALESSSNVPNCIKSLRSKTAPSLGIQKMKHKPHCSWESLYSAQVLPSGNSIRSLHLGAFKLQQLRDTLSSTPATAAWIAGPKCTLHSLLAILLLPRPPRLGRCTPASVPWQGGCARVSWLELFPLAGSCWPSSAGITLTHTHGCCPRGDARPGMRPSPSRSPPRGDVSPSCEGPAGNLTSATKNKLCPSAMTRGWLVLGLGGAACAPSEPFPCLSQTSKHFKIKQERTVKSLAAAALSHTFFWFFFFPLRCGTTPTLCQVLIGFPKRQCPINCLLCSASALSPTEAQHTCSTPERGRCQSSGTWAELPASCCRALAVAVGCPSCPSGPSGCPHARWPPTPASTR